MSSNLTTLTRLLFCLPSHRALQFTKHRFNECHRSNQVVRRVENVPSHFNGLCARKFQVVQFFSPRLQKLCALSSVYAVL